MNSPAIINPMGQLVSPPTYPYIPQYVNMNQGSPGLQPTQNLTQNNSQESSVLQSVLTRLDNIDRKLGQLNTIQLTVDKITVRLDSMDQKITEIEKSQIFISEQYETVSKCTNSNKACIDQLQNDVKHLRLQNESLKSKNDEMMDGIIDLKCRSMRDNLLFFGVPEGIQQIPDNPLNAGVETLPFNRGLETEADITDSEHPCESSEAAGGSPENTTQPTDTLPNSINSNLSYSNVASQNEDCKAKVFDFCYKILGIKNPDKLIKINRAHRIGIFIPGKIRPLVANFDSDSKSLIQSALKTVKPRTTPYNVSEQFPPEVKERRKALIPELIKARRDGKTAFLRRDKLIIQESRSNTDKRDLFLP
jgi:hypothetical protein